MKHSINLGAYGWQRGPWLGTFYPEDLPENWQLTYYSNEFNTVLVPASYWQTQEERVSVKVDCADWLDNVHDEFQFFVECHVAMFEHVSLSELIDNLKQLQSQLSALVFIDDNQAMSETVSSQFDALFDALAVEVIGASAASGSQLVVQSKDIWRLNEQGEKTQASSFAFIENDLTDLRRARKIVEDFVSQLENDERASEATIIVNHPQLQASDLSKFRSLLEIMGF